MNSQKHIVILTPGFPENEDDTNCIPPLQDYVRLLAEKNHVKISIITLQYPTQKLNYNWHNIDVYSCGGNDVKFPMRFIIWKDAVKIFKMINKEFRADIIHSFFLSECALIGNYLSSKYRIRHINTMMGKEVKESNKYLHFINFNKVKVISLSKLHAELFNRITNSKSFTIPWGLDKHFLPRPINVERKIDIIGVGSLTTLKNFSSFINIVARVKESRPDIRCLIIGDGPLKSKLIGQVEELKLDSNTVFTKKILRNEVFDYMMQSKILLHTSSFESFGMVFIEAMYYGLYIVSNTIGIAESSNRWRICKSEDEIVNATLQLLSSNLDHESVIEYSMDDTVESYLNIYSSFD